MPRLEAFSSIIGRMLLQLLLTALLMGSLILIELLMFLLLELELRIRDYLLRSLVVYSHRFINDGVITFV